MYIHTLLMANNNSQLHNYDYVKIHDTLLIENELLKVYIYICTYIWYSLNAMLHSLMSALEFKNLA